MKMILVMNKDNVKILSLQVLGKGLEKDKLFFFFLDKLLKSMFWGT